MSNCPPKGPDTAARSAYIELAALGVSPATGNAKGLDSRTAAQTITRLIRLLEAHREGLHEILVDRDDPDLAAVREEGEA